MSSISRFNPKTGVLDFWNEFRKPNPFRLPMLLAATIPLLVIFYWLSGEVHYKTPERPQITYITSFAPDRTDEEIAASNETAEEVKELREAAQKEVAERKRDTYKALGAAMGMDVEKIAAEADARRAAEQAAAEAKRAELRQRPQGSDAEAADAPAADAQVEGNQP